MTTVNTIKKTLKTSVIAFVALVTFSGFAKNNEVHTRAFKAEVEFQKESEDYDAFRVTVVGKGRPVLLIPGLSSSSDVWDGTVEALKQDYQLHVFNLAGFAGIAPVASDMIGASFLQFQKSQIQQYIAQKQLKNVVVVGHSLGGFLSLWLATENSENVDAVINVDGLPALGALFAKQRTQQQSASQSSNAAPPAFDPIAMVKGMANNTQWHDKMVKDMKTSDPMTAGRAMGELMQYDIRNELKNIAIPTLTLAAPAQGLPYVSYEVSQQNYTEQLNNIAPQFNKVAFAKTAKHFIMADEPEWMNKQIAQFIEQL